MSNGLYEAVTECRFKQLQFLVESGLSVNHKNTHDQHTLVAALQIEHDVKRNRMIRYLLKHKANCRTVDNKTKRDIFMWACFLGRTSEAQMILSLIEDDFDFHRKDIYGRTALHYATMRGNAELVEFICKKMAKYDLTVDVRDLEGFTPFLMAKRLGFDDCANILLQEGMASAYQFDHKERKMGHVWEEEGMKEHMTHLSHNNKQKVAMYKTLGRLPALKRAHFDSSKVKVVKSWKDRKFLANTDIQESPLSHRDISDFSRAASRNPKRSVSMTNLSDLDEDISNTGLDKFTLNIPRDMMARSSSPPADPRPCKHIKPATRSRSLNVASTDEAMRLINIDTPQPLDHDTESTYSSPPETFRSSIADSLPEMMTILEEQSSHAYRPRAKPRPKDITEMAMKQERSNSRSTMAIIFSRDGSKKVVKKEVGAMPSIVKKQRNGRLSSIREATEHINVHSRR